jgi:hypothetical protein
LSTERLCAATADVTVDIDDPSRKNVLKERDDATKPASYNEIWLPILVMLRTDRLLPRER